MIGEVLGNYRIVAPLGRGGMASIFVGEHQVLGHRVAIKVLRDLHFHDPTSQQRLLNEARAVANIRHPSIVELHDFAYGSGGVAYMVMELLEGEDLRTRLRRGELTERQIATLGGHIAGALAAAHEHGVIHRDLKPSNIFLVRDPESESGERAKLLDFGIAKRVRRADRPVDDLTAAGMLIGTPAYMSPEQCEGGEIDERSDIYSFGVVAYRMATAQLPYEGHSDDDILNHIIAAPTPPREVRPELSPALDALIMRCLIKEPEGRFQSMTELASALAAIAPASQPPIEDPEDKTAKVELAQLSAKIAAPASPPTQDPDATSNLESSSRPQAAQAAAPAPTSTRVLSPTATLPSSPGTNPNPSANQGPLSQATPRPLPTATPPPTPLPAQTPTPTPLPAQTPPPIPLPAQVSTPTQTPLPAQVSAPTPPPQPTPLPIPTPLPRPTPLPTPSPTPPPTPPPMAASAPAPADLATTTLPRTTSREPARRIWLGVIAATVLLFAAGVATWIAGSGDDIGELSSTNSPPPTSSPQPERTVPADAMASLRPPGFDEMIGQAEEAMAAADYGVALESCAAALRLRANHERAGAICAIAACKLGDHASGRDYAARLSATDELAAVATACAAQSPEAVPTETAHRDKPPARPKPGERSATTRPGRDTRSTRKPPTSFEDVKVPVLD